MAWPPGWLEVAEDAVLMVHGLRRARPLSDGPTRPVSDAEFTAAVEADRGR